MDRRFTNPVGMVTGRCSTPDIVRSACATSRSASSGCSRGSSASSQSRLWSTRLVSTTSPGCERRGSTVGMHYQSFWPRTATSWPPAPADFRGVCSTSSGRWPSYYLHYFYAHDAVVEQQRSGVPRAQTVAEIESELLETLSRSAGHREAGHPRAAAEGRSTARPRSGSSRRSRGTSVTFMSSTCGTATRLPVWRRTTSSRSRPGSLLRDQVPLAQAPLAPSCSVSFSTWRRTSAWPLGPPRVGDPAPRSEGTARTSAHRPGRSLRRDLLSVFLAGGGCRMTRGIVLAVDGGNSKTDLALVSEDGSARSRCGGGPRSTRRPRSRGCLDVLEELLDEALREARLARERSVRRDRQSSCSRASTSLRRRGTEAAARRARMGGASRRRERHVRRARAQGPIAGGASRSSAAPASTASALLPTAATLASRHSARSPATGEAAMTSGRRASGRAQRGRPGAETSLEHAVPRYFGLSTPQELAEAIDGRVQQSRIIELAPVVLAEAERDSGAAQNRRSARRGDRRAGSRRTEGLELHEPTGSSWEEGSSKTQRRTPRRRSREPGSPTRGRSSTIRATASAPIVGAALLGLDALERPQEAEVACQRQLAMAARRRSRVMADVRFEQATRVYPGTQIPAVDALDLYVDDGGSSSSLDRSAPGRPRR